MGIDHSKTKILLFTTPTRIYAPNYIVPTGILSLASFLIKYGIDVKVVDLAKERYEFKIIKSIIDDYNPALIGIGGIITAYSYIISLSNEIKDSFPNIPIVLGGQVTINNDENCFRHMGIDFLIKGYGEIPLYKLISEISNNTRQFRQIPGLSYRENGNVIKNEGREYVKHLDDLPLPAYHLVDVEYYATVLGTNNTKLVNWAQKRNKHITNFRSLSMMGSLGCVARCTFCVHEQEYVGLKFYSEAYLRDHISHLYNSYNIRVLTIGEEMFIANPKRAEKISRMLSEEFPDLYWRSSTRADFVTQELIGILDNEYSTCYAIGYGFESGNDNILKIMNKGTTRYQNVNAFRLLDNSKYLRGDCSFMVGNVGENYQSIKETAKAIREANIYGSAVFYTHPYPGGRIWDWAVENGIIQDTHKYLLRVSGEDAAKDVHINLTPYPDWVVRGWNAWLKSVLAKNNLKRRRKGFEVKNWKQRIFQIIEIYFPKVGHFRIPFFLLTLSLYIRDRIAPLSAIDSKYYIRLDKNGALLPKKLQVGIISREFQNK